MYNRIMSTLLNAHMSESFNYIHLW